MILVPIHGNEVLVAGDELVALVATLEFGPVIRFRHAEHIAATVQVRRGNRLICGAGLRPYRWMEGVVLLVQIRVRIAACRRHQIFHVAHMAIGQQATTLHPVHVAQEGRTLLPANLQALDSDWRTLVIGANIGP